MTAALKYLALAILACAAASCPAAAQVTLPENTALFTKPDPLSAPVGAVSGEVEVKREFHQYTHMHPLAYRHQFYEIVRDGKTFYASPEIRADSTQVLPFPLWRHLAAVLAAAVGLFTAWRHFRERKSGALAPGSRREAAYFLIEALALRYALSFAMLAEFSNLLPAAADDNGYFEVGYDLWNRSFTRPWRFTLGNGLWYIPFIALLKAKEFYDIALAVDYFNLLVTAPAVLVLAFLTLRKLGIPLRAAAAALFTGVLWCFVACHLENWDACRFPGFFVPPVPDAADPLGMWKFYRFCIGAGFNAMSDMPGLLAVLATIYCALSLPLKARHAALTAALYGFACLIRINYCFMAPLLAFIWLIRMREAKLAWREVALHAVAGAAAFLALFGWQLFVNYRDFGSILRFGYVLHYLDFPAGERPADGFTFHTLTQWRNLKFLFGANHAAWTLFFAGTLFLRDRKLRTVFVLWAAPITIFFLGYYQTYCDAARFILPVFVAFFGAFFAFACRRETPPRRIAAAISAVGVLVVCGRLNPRLGVAVWYTLVPAALLAAAAAFYLWRQGDRRLAAMVGFAVVYCALASPFVGGILLVLLLLRSVFDIYRLFVPAGC